MFLKRKIICALDQYEDIELKPHEVLGAINKREAGITQGAFISWFRTHDKNSKYTYQTVDKCINDCIEDEYINRIFVNGQLSPKQSIHAGMSIMNNLDNTVKWEYEQIENIFVSSKGRELKHWYFFYPSLLEKMSAREIAFFAITTGITILLGYLGVQRL